MNVITLTGNLCKDLELRVSQSGKKILENTIGVSKEKKNAQGQYESDFIKIVSFDGSAEYLSKYAKKGDKIEVVGKLRVDPYTDKEGKYKTDTYVVVDKVKILTSRPMKPQEQETKVLECETEDGYPQITEDDFPF